MAAEYGYRACQVATKMETGLGTIDNDNMVMGNGSGKFEATKLTDHRSAAENPVGMKFLLSRCLAVLSCRQDASRSYHAHF